MDKKNVSNEVIIFVRQILTYAFLHLFLVHFVLGLDLRSLLSDLEKPLVLLLELGLEGIELGHLGVSGCPHTVNELLDVSDPCAGVGNVFGQIINFGFL